MTIHMSPAMKLEIHNAWQRQYLVSLKGDFTCSTLHMSPAMKLEIQNAWQAPYLVSLKGDCTCSAHCK